MSLVAIYRHQLFKGSESFIHHQALNVPRHKKLYVGRTCVGEIPPDTDVATLEQLHRTSPVGRLRQAITRDPSGFIELLENRGVDLLHAHFAVEGVYAQRIAEKLDIPLITTFHGFDATMTRRALVSSGKPAWINYVLHRKRLAQRGALFICVSEFIREKVLKLGFPAARTVVHYIGVDTRAILPSLERTSEPTVLHVARLVEKKGTTDLVTAFSRVLRSIPEAKLQIVGDGVLEASLRQQVRRLDIEDSVRFLGAQPNSQVLALMAKAWVFCLPSVTAKSGDSEGLAIALLEAAASGLPIVATQHGSFGEAIKHEESGLLHPEHDVNGLTASLTLLLGDERARVEMGNRAREVVVNRFDLVKQSSILADMYESVR